MPKVLSLQNGKIKEILISSGTGVQHETYNAPTYASNLTLDFSTADVFYLNLTGDVTLTLQNLTNNRRYLILAFANGANRNVVFPTGVYMPLGDGTIGITANRTTVFEIVQVNNKTYVFPSEEFAQV